MVRMGWVKDPSNRRPYIYCENREFLLIHADINQELSRLIETLSKDEGLNGVVAFTASC